MATLTNYTFNKSTDFPNATGEISITALREDILKLVDIYHTLDSISASYTEVTLTFRDALDAVEVVALNTAIAAFKNIDTSKAEPLTLTGVVESRPLPPEGSRINFFMPNLTDKTTWYSSSVLVSEEVLTDSGDGLTFITVHSPIVDVSHGKIFAEHTLSNYKLVCSVDGVAKTEKDKHSNIGDFSFDYVEGKLTFDSSQAGKAVKLSYYKVQGSTFFIKPQPGKVLRILQVEALFSSDFNIKDSVVFQGMGDSEAFAPQLGLPPGTVIPLGSPTVYNTFDDFLDDSNGAFPSVPAPASPAAVGNWRMRQSASLSVPWKYKTSMPLYSSKGMELHVFLEHDLPWEGSKAGATFYCISEQEDSE